jgi:hypothetical protein
MLGEKDDSGELRRDFIRTLVRTETLEVEVLLADGKKILGQSRDVSLSGIFVQTTEPPPPGTELHLLVSSLSGTAALRILSRIVHSEPGVGFGARFVAPAEEARGYLVALISKLTQHA